MRELDRILECFLEQDYRELGSEDRQRFAEILELPDPDLYAYLVGKAEASDPALARLLHAIRASKAH
jgi:antitoxin CptB